MDGLGEFLVLIIMYSVILSVTRAFRYSDVLDLCSLILLESSLVEDLVESVVHLIRLVDVPFILIIGCNHHYIDMSLVTYCYHVVYFVANSAGFTKGFTLVSHCACLPVIIVHGIISLGIGSGIPTCRWRDLVPQTVGTFVWYPQL